MTSSSLFPGSLIPGWEVVHASGHRPGPRAPSRARRRRRSSFRTLLRASVMGVLVAASFSVASGVARWYGTAVVRERLVEASFVIDDTTPRIPSAQARTR